MKSTKTRAEFNTMAMLLGGFYDHEDHTLCCSTNNDNIYDADTMELVCDGNMQEYMHGGSRFNGTNPWQIRKRLVERGVIGCADGPFNYEEDK